MITLPVLAWLLAACAPDLGSCGGDGVPTVLDGDWVVEEAGVWGTHLDDLRVHIEGDTLEMRYLVDGVEHVAVYAIGE